MAEQIKRPVTGPQMHSTSAVQGMTPKEIMGIIRRHLLLIVLMTFLGFAAGGTSWYLLKKHSPRYTAETFIEVLPPIEKDPTVIGGVRANKDIEYASRQSIASRIKQQRTFQILFWYQRIISNQHFLFQWDIITVRNYF